MLGLVCKVTEDHNCIPSELDHFYFTKNTEMLYYDLKSHAISVQNQLNVEWKRHHHSVTHALSEDPHLKLLGKVSIW